MVLIRNTHRSWRVDGMVGLLERRHTRRQGPLCGAFYPRDQGFQLVRDGNPVVLRLLDDDLRHLCEGARPQLPRIVITNNPARVSAFLHMKVVRAQELNNSPAVLW